MLSTSYDHTTTESSSCSTCLWVYAQWMWSTRKPETKSGKIIVHIKNMRFAGTKESGGVKYFCQMNSVGSGKSREQYPDYKPAYSGICWLIFTRGSWLGLLAIEM